MNKNQVTVDVAQPSLTIGKLTDPQTDTKENVAKKYLKGEVQGAKAQQEQITTENNVDFQLTNKETKENQTEVRLTQTYKSYKVYGQDLIIKVDKNGVITTVSIKAAQNLARQSNLTITNFLSKNEVKTFLRNALQVLNDALEKDLLVKLSFIKNKTAVTYMHTLLYLHIQKIVKLLIVKYYSKKKW